MISLFTAYVSSQAHEAVYRPILDNDAMFRMFLSCYQQNRFMVPVKVFRNSSNTLKTEKVLEYLLNP